MNENRENLKELIKRIEEFKMEIDKVKSFTSEERLVILKSFTDVIFRQSINDQSRTALESPTRKVEDTNLVFKGGNGFQTFAELVRSTKLKQHPDLILLATYYLIVFKKYESVTTTDIEQQYSTAMLKASTNTNANINVNRKKGFMMEGEKKEGKMSFKITMSGVDYMDSILKSV